MELLKNFLDFIDFQNNFLIGIHCTKR